MTTNPDEYPAECTVSADELAKLKDAHTSHEDWKSYTSEWPPTDRDGNAYPIWYTVDELNERGELIDSNGNNYSPFTGSLVPTTRTSGDSCNAPLSNWRERYPNIRYCSRLIHPEDEAEQTYCGLHKGRGNVKTAEEHLQTGLHTKTLDHLYEKIGPWQQLLGWGIYEGLMGESAYDFASEYNEKTFDFADEPVRPDGCTEDGLLTVKVGYPTEYLDPALSLFAAAMMRVQMMTVQPRIMEEKREDGVGMMESKTVETAQLTAPPSEHDPSPQQFKTLETWSEHHLNLPFSRLFNDMEKALERGGVTTDPEAEDDDDISADEIVLSIDADGEDIETTDDGTDPNQFDGYQSQSEEIAQHVASDDTD